jgi:hypothetical protein
MGLYWFRRCKRPAGTRSGSWPTTSSPELDNLDANDEKIVTEAKRGIAQLEDFLAATALVAA